MLRRTRVSLTMSPRGHMMRHATTFVFVGRFQPESFAEFVHHRAKRLSLSAGLGLVGVERIEVAVAGEEDLVDAFEMACSLGPIDCLVVDSFRSTERQ
jgi:acylphosphatase